MELTPQAVAAPSTPFTVNGAGVKVEGVLKGTDVDDVDDVVDDDIDDGAATGAKGV